MPPETKPIITKLEDMVCENCVYSYGKTTGSCSVVDWQCNNPESKKPIYDTRKTEDFCSRGKWLTGRRYTSDYESEINLEDFDDTYYGIVRAQMFPDAVSWAKEYDIRQQILKHLDVCVKMDVDNKRFNDMLCIPKTEVARARELLVELWGDQE